MKLIGAVTTSNMVVLEKRAHGAFASARFFGDGGTEYFTVNPEDVLAWLRAETPRFELESARNDAWSEYVASHPWKTQSRITMFCLSGFMIAAFVGSFWQLGRQNVPMAIAMPFIAGAVFGCLSYVLRRVFFPNIEQELKSARTALEEKHHLPPGSLSGRIEVEARATPTPPRIAS